MEIFSCIVCLLLVSSSYGAITFDGTKSSFAQFHRWQPSSSSSGVVGMLSMHFKTHLKDCLLLYQDDGIADYLSIELKNGQILATVHSSANSVRVDIGQDLDDAYWHDLVLRITNNRLDLTLDEALTKSANNLSQNNALLSPSTYLYIGGIPRSLSLASLAWMGAAFKKGFVGCVKKVMTSNVEDKIERAVLIKSRGTKSGCLNVCRARNPCLNNGKCINRFSEAKCDCRGTGFEGTKCEIEILQLHLKKKDYIVYDMSSNPAATKADFIRIKFKTSKKNGILLKTEFAHDYVIIKLSQGLVVVEWNLGSGELQISVPNKMVNDNKWHDLRIKRNKRVVTISLDEGNDVVGTTPPKLTAFNMHGGEGKVYVGGDGSSSKQFVGCLRWVMFHGVELISKLKGKDPRISVRGKTAWNCPLATTTPRPTTALLSTVTDDRSRNLDLKSAAKLTTKRRVKSTLKAIKASKPTEKYRTTTQCSPNDVKCVFATFSKTVQPAKTLGKKTKPTDEPSEKQRTDKNVITGEGGNNTSTAKTPNVQGLKDKKDLGNIPTAIGLVAGSIVLFVVCAVISIKVKKMRDRKSTHSHRIKIEVEEVDQPDSYDNKS